MFGIYFNFIMVIFMMSFINFDFMDLVYFKLILFLFIILIFNLISFKISNLFHFYCFKLLVIINLMFDYFIHFLEMDLFMNYLLFMFSYLLLKKFY